MVKSAGVVSHAPQIEVGPTQRRVHKKVVHASLGYHSGRRGLLIEGISTLEHANRYLQEDFLSWWNQHLAVVPANPADAHRTLDKTCNLDSILSCVDTRQVASDYTIRFQGKIYQIARADVGTGLRGGMPVWQAAQINKTRG